MSASQIHTVEIVIPNDHTFFLPQKTVGKLSLKKEFFELMKGDRRDSGTIPKETEDNENRCEKIKI